MLTLEVGCRLSGARVPGKLNSSPKNPSPAGSPAARPAALQDIEHADELDLSGSVQPVALPLRVSMFDRVPVVVSARQFGTTGRPSEPFARLLLR